VLAQAGRDFPTGAEKPMKRCYTVIASPAPLSGTEVIFKAKKPVLESGAGQSNP